MENIQELDVEIKSEPLYDGDYPPFDITEEDIKKLIGWWAFLLFCYRFLTEQLFSRTIFVVSLWKVCYNNKDCFYKKI